MLNKTILMGRLTADPELKQTPNGVNVTSFVIAVERNIPDKATGNRKADFITIVAWRGTAELVCKYFSKGSLMALEGSIQCRDYEVAGKKRTAFEVIADQVYFTGQKKEEKQQVYDDRLPISIGDFEEIDDDSDLPF